MENLTMRATSEAQRRAMYAAAEGRSTLGIPKKVGEEFVGKDSAGQAASLMLVAPDGDVLVLRRASNDTNWPGHWCWPGGKSEEGEDAETTAARETTEEIGTLPSGTRQHIDARGTPNGWVHHTFAQSVEKKFAPVLTDEHSGYAWAPLRSLPEPLHPGLRDMLAERLGIAADMAVEAWDALRSNFVKWTKGEDIEPEPDVVAANDALAMDRNSVRTFDQDGHLRVEMTPISKANVCPYYGREIPDFEALGLDPQRLYNLYRDADELAKAASTFIGKPLLLKHVPVSAKDHPREITVGSIGDAVEFHAPYLMAPLNIWDGAAIALIESDRQKELSSSYRYRADMTPGTLAGESYDGVMRDISANHVALVEEGRAGPDVVVGDSKQEIITMKKTALLSRMASVAHGAIIAHVMPKLAADQKIDVSAALVGVTAKNFKAKRPAIIDAIGKAAKGKLAADAKLDGLEALLVALDEVQEAMDEEDDEEDEKKKKKAEDSEEEEKKKKAAEDAAEEEAKKKAAEDAEKDDDDKVDKKAMDSAISAAVDRTKREVRAEMLKLAADIRTAEEAVRPYIGKLAMAHDSADAVYRTALTSLGVDIEGVPAAAFPAILKAQPLPGTNPVQQPRVAMDAAGVNSFHEMFPAAKTHIVKSL
jgi:8-oxo-dGTP pyrophosphatase MutT (NUDIX family)